MEHVREEKIKTRHQTTVLYRMTYILRQQLNFLEKT